MKKFLTYIFIFSLVVACMVIPALATDVNGNEFFDPKDYAYIDYVEDHTVTYDVTVPDNWYRTGVFEAPEWSRNLGHFNGSRFSFETVDWGISLLMHPLGDNASVGFFPGDQIKNAHIIDITYIPKNTWFQSGYRIGIDAVGLDDVGSKDWVILYFVDENGVVVHRHEVVTQQELQTGSNGESYIWFSYHANMGDMNIPDSAVGLVPIYTVKNLTVGTEKTVTVEYSPFTFWFSMSALQWEAQENARLQNTMNDIQAKMDEIVNGEPDPVAPNGSGAVDDLNGAEEQLKNESQQGLDDGIGFLQNALSLINQYGPAFLCVISLFRPFAQLPLFSALLTISLGLSVCAIVLNIGLEVGRFSASKDARKQKR